ncbi:TPA: hypothetical protein ACKQHJ_000112 [Pseudomonas aeruginosa]|uniref:hypothetical protein n=1 Tax=Pseudomonas aeruginosa TaxID=287 RepID=UPI0020A63C72|nr:hypothetical protein [Pseudomonas aeruginosa]
MTTSKIQMDQIRSTSATVTGENIRAGSQKKSSLSQAEGLQGASPDATCTCPSGDGSLVHPCPAHPASVEQAGGDERAAFEAAYQTEHAGFMGPLKLERREDGEYKSEHVGSAWRMWQARAALAQPSPVSEALIYACKNLAQITSSDGSGHADIALAILRMAGVCDDERERLVNEWKAARAWKPSPAQAEQAEAERPEVVAWRYGFSGGIVSDKACLDEWKSGGEYQSLMTVAQHERIVGALRFERQQMDRAFTACINERDAALANVDALVVQVLKLGGTISFDYHPVAQAGQVPQAWLDVQAERRRQVEVEGWTPEHDDAHSHGEMARAAACYALAGSSAPNDGTAALLVSLAWPWDEQWWKPSTARRDMVKACALALAEIERLDRAGISQNPQPGATTASS